MKKRISTISLLFCITICFSQEYVNNKLNVSRDTVPEFSKRIKINSTLESMHTWRGNASADRPTITGQLAILLDKKHRLKLGVWSASAFNKENSGDFYQEIDYFLVYQYHHFSVGIWDQFSTKGLVDPDIFDYNKNTTNHYIDLELIYFFSDDFPLRLQADIALYGNDYELDASNNLQRRYSTYFEARYRAITTSKIKFGPFVGVGMALNGKTMGYGNGKNNFDLVNIGVMADKMVRVANWQFPVRIVTFWNPAQKLARLQLSVNLF